MMHVRCISRAHGYKSALAASSVQRIPDVVAPSSVQCTPDISRSLVPHSIDLAVRTHLYSYEIALANLYHDDDAHVLS